MEATSFLPGLETAFEAFTKTATQNITPPGKKTARKWLQTDLFTAMGLPPTAKLAAMDALMTSISRKERKYAEHLVIRRNQVEWTLSRDGSVVSIAMGLDGRDDEILSRDCGNVHAANAFFAHAKMRIKSGEGFNEIPDYSEPRHKATGGNRYAFYGTPIRSEAEAKALIEAIGAASLSTMRRSIVSRYQHCIEPEEIENIVEFSLYNAALTFEANKTKGKTTDGTTRPFRAYAVMCAKNRIRKLIKSEAQRSERMPMESLDVPAYDNSDGNMSRLDLIASEGLTPAEICEQNEFRDRRKFARAEGDWILILLVLSGAWLIPLCEKIGRTIRGLFGKLSGILNYNN